MSTTYICWCCCFVVVTSLALAKHKGQPVIVGACSNLPMLVIFSLNGESLFSIIENVRIPGLSSTLVSLGVTGSGVVCHVGRRMAAYDIDFALDKPRAHWVAHDTDVRSVAMAREANCVVSGSVGGEIALWDLRTLGSGKASLSMKHGSTPVTAVAGLEKYSLISGGRDGTIQIWDTRFATPSSKPIECGDSSAGNNKVISLMPSIYCMTVGVTKDDGLYTIDIGSSAVDTITVGDNKTVKLDHTAVVWAPGTNAEPTLASMYVGSTKGVVNVWRTPAT